MECKFWLDSLNFDVEEAYSYNMNSSNKREVKKIIFEYFEFIERNVTSSRQKGRNDQTPQWRALLY